MTWLLLVVAIVALLVGAVALLRGAVEPSPPVQTGSVVAHLRINATRSIPIIVPSRTQRLFVRGQTWDHVSTTAEGEWIYEQVK